MNIIFLDFDGVIATPDSCVAFEKAMWCIDPTKARMIERLCRETNSMLVITSTWKQGHSWSTFIDLMTAYNLDKYLFYVKNTDIDLWKAPGLLGIRGKEVDEWLLFASEYEEIGIEKYIIIDDSSDFTDDQKEKYLIQTDPSIGFNSEDFYKAREMLGYVEE
jgi:hypothetical protein